MCTACRCAMTIALLACLFLALGSHAAGAAEKKPADPKPKAAKPAEGKAVSRPAKKPAPGPKPPVFKDRDVPEPVVPDLTEVPPGFQPETWQSWSTGQEVSGMRRFCFFLTAGASIPRDAMAGNGVNAPNYDEIIDTGGAFGFEAGVALMPILHITASYRALLNSGSTFHFDDGGMGQDWDFEGMEVHHLALNVKLRIPVFVWTLSSRHFRFSKGEELTGVVLFVKGSLGIAMLPDVGMERWDPSYAYQDYWWSTTNLATGLTAGLEVRWDWGAVIGEFGFANFGQPEVSDFGEAAEADVYSVLIFGAGFALFF